MLCIFRKRNGECTREAEIAAGNRITMADNVDQGRKNWPLGPYKSGIEVSTERIDISRPNIPSRSSISPLSKKGSQESAFHPSNLPNKKGSSQNLIQEAPEEKHGLPRVRSQGRNI